MHLNAMARIEKENGNVRDKAKGMKLILAKTPKSQSHAVLDTLMAAENQNEI
jgi:hypothetical protein